MCYSSVIIIIKSNICSRTFQVSAGDVVAERNVRAGANSDPRGEMRENVYCFLGCLYY